MSEGLKFRMEDPEAKLATAYIEEYLHSHGQTMESICTLPKEQAKRLMIEASTYAAMKLAEVDTKARAIQELHGTLGSGQLQSE